MAWLWLVPTLLLALTCVPMGVAFEVTSIPRWQGTVRLSWAGFLETRVPLGRDAARAQAGREPATEPSSSARRQLPTRPSALLPALGHLAELVRRLVAQTHVRSLAVNARLGLDEPADTGMLYGALAPLFVWLHARCCRACAFEPEFTRECLEVSASGRLTLVPARYLLVMGRFLVDPRTWRIAFDLTRPLSTWMH
jgi:hypothetical protein